MECPIEGNAARGAVRSRRGRLRHRFIVETALILGLLLLASLARGDGFGSTASPSHYVADSSTHTWISTEGNQTERFAIESIFDNRMVNQYNNRTDLTTVKVSSYDSFVDVYWFVTDISIGAADAVCISYVDLNSNPPVCNQVRVRFDPDWVFAATDSSKKQGTCHEIGHSVGFDDSQPENNTGCMSGGTNGTLSDHEIQHINQQY